MSLADYFLGAETEMQGESRRKRRTDEHWPKEDQSSEPRKPDPTPAHADTCRAAGRDGSASVPSSTQRTMRGRDAVDLDEEPDEPVVTMQMRQVELGTFDCGACEVAITEKAIRFYTGKAPRFQPRGYHEEIELEMTALTNIQIDKCRGLMCVTGFFGYDILEHYSCFAVETSPKSRALFHFNTSCDSLYDLDRARGRGWTESNEYNWVESDGDKWVKSVMPLFRNIRKKTHFNPGRIDFAAELRRFKRLQAGEHERFRRLSHMLNGRRELSTVGKATAAVAAMNAEPGSARVQRTGCSTLAELARQDAAGVLASAARSPSRLFAPRGAQAVVDAGGVAAVVAAMELADAEVQCWGCVALANLASGGAACKQSVVKGRGVAVVVSAMGRRTANAQVQYWGCNALKNLAEGGAACAQAIVGGVAALVAAMGQCPKAAADAAGALEMIAASTNPTAVLEEVARTQTDCSRWDALREKLRKCALARLQAAEEGTAVAALEHAIKLAAAVQVGAAALEHARGRVREINDDAERQERCKSFGLGSLALPDEFICPITMEKMRGVPPPPLPLALLAHPGHACPACATDPAMASDGRSYERSAILSHLRVGNGLSPLTRERLQPNVLIQNWNLKRRIQGHEEDMLCVAATAVAHATNVAQQPGPAAGGGEPSSEPAPKRIRDYVTDYYSINKRHQ